MTNEERARQYAALFTHYGDRWRANTPLDATVHGDTVYLGGQRIERAADGTWSVTTS